MTTATKKPPSVFLDGSNQQLTTVSVPHKKVRHSGNTYYIAQYPEGDYAIHVDYGRGGGYGDSNVGFLLEDGTIEIVRGPFSTAGLFDFGTAEKMAEVTGIPGIAATATRLTVGKNLRSYCTPGTNEEIVYEEEKFQLGDWRERVRPEWLGLDAKIHTRCGNRNIRLTKKVISTAT